jgi:hypothetical protein
VTDQTTQDERLKRRRSGGDVRLNPDNVSNAPTNEWRPPCRCHLIEPPDVEPGEGWHRDDGVNDVGVGEFPKDGRTVCMKAPAHSED